MAVLETNITNETKLSFPRRIAAYITSMNFAKVFRRQHPRESSSPIAKSNFLPRPPHHRYSRPFSYHIPATELITPSSLIKTSNSVPYRIGLSSDSALLANGQTNANDDIVRLPIKTSRGHSPKSRKDRRHQSQLNANKRWLFRSMEALDGWKERVFPPKIRTSNSSQSRSRSVENFADENILINSNPSRFKQQRAVSPNRSIDMITNRASNGIDIHRKSIPNRGRSPALTIEKQLSPNHYNQTNERNPSAILDFRELSALSFSHSRPRLNDEHETNSLTPSEDIANDVNLSDDDDDDDDDDHDHEDVTSNLSFHPNAADGHENGDPWDFSITWIDSLKEQRSPQRKIQFYENLIKLLEQDTLTIDELLVLRKILAKIWPIDETNPPLFPIDSKTNGTRSLHTPNKIKQRSKLPTIPHHTAQRCSAVLESSLSAYEPLHEQNSGHGTKSPPTLLATKAKPCFIEHTYPQHLNPFDEKTDKSKILEVEKNNSSSLAIDVKPSAPPAEELNQNNNDSIRRYFERLTLLETIYEKLNIESNKKPVQSTDHYHPQQLTTQENTTQSHHSPEKRTPIKEEATHRLPLLSPSKSAANKFVEMNVDGNGSIGGSSKSSAKRRAPTAPHLSQTKNSNPPMFTLSSADLNIAHKPQKEIHIPIQIQSSHEKTVRDKAASCDEDGHIFVYDSQPDHLHEESSTVLPKKTERIQQWLSSCETKEEVPPPPKAISPNTQYKMRCIAKPNRHPSVSPPRYPEKTPPPANPEIEPARFRTCLKIHLETTEPSNHRSRASSATSRSHQRQSILSNEDLDVTEEEYFQQSTLSPVSFQRDHQAVFL